jgi:type IV secretion system protein VirB10
LNLPPLLSNRPPLKPWQWAALAGVGLGAYFIAAPVWHSMNNKPAPPLPPATIQMPQGKVWKSALDLAPEVKRQPPPNPPPATDRHLPLPDKAAPSDADADILISKNIDDREKSQGSVNAERQPQEHQKGELEARLEPTVLTGTKATRIHNLAFKILQGRQIPCTQQTAINTSYPGFVTAVIPIDIRGSDPNGSVVLIDAGSTVFGSMQRAMTNGLSRQFVLWENITTPSGVRISVNSPAADEVGATGLPVDVNRHFWQKLAGAALVSIANGGSQAIGSIAGSALSSRGSTNVNSYEFQNFGNQTGELLAKGLIDIPDVGERPQGSSCSIYVARDLDFSAVYRLETRQ